MKCVLEFSDEFNSWRRVLKSPTKERIGEALALLAEQGTQLPFPFSSQIKGSKVSHMRELRIKHKSAQIRVLYAFDPKRNAFVILGGDKVGDDRWYEKAIPKAEKIYARHLEALT